MGQTTRDQYMMNLIPQLQTTPQNGNRRVRAAWFRVVGTGWASVFMQSRTFVEPINYAN